MTHSSHWYFPIFNGLIERKHVHAMGPSLWLYLYILSRAYPGQKDGLIEYSHLDAAMTLGRTDRTIKTWFSRLQKHGLIVRRTRHRDYLSVQVQKWRTVEEWLIERQDGDNGHKGKIPSLHKLRSEGRSEQRSEETFPYIISILLLGYEYPETSTSLAQAPHVCLADAFQDLMGKLRISKNKQALLRQIYRLCFGGTDAELPAYSYFGRVAKIVGGAGYLAKLMWGLSATRPEGDVLAYIQAMHKAKQRRGDVEKQELPGPAYAKDGPLRTILVEDSQGNTYEETIG